MKRAAIMVFLAVVVFSIPCSAQLVNGQFAAPYNYIDANTSVANGWTHYRLLSSNPQFQQSSFEQMPGGPGGQVSCQQIWSNWSFFEAGVYQRVSGVVAGQTYRATGWFLSISQHGVSVDPPYQDGNITQRIGIDPYGGTDPDASSVVWSWTDPLDRRWRELQVTAVAASSTITVFARTFNLYAHTNCLSFYDAFGLTVANPIKVTGVSTRPGSTSATISWTTDVPASSRVEYLVYRGTVKDPISVSDSTLKTQHSITLTGLQQNTQYYCKIISKASGRDDGVVGGIRFTTMTGTECPSLVQARSYPDGTRIFLRDMIVTCGSNQSSAYVFIEQGDRAAGIRSDRPVIGVSAGQVVDVSGTLSTVAGERRLVSPTFTVVKTGPPLLPLAMRSTAVGGADVDGRNAGITGGTGPYNIGSLVKVWGKITAVDTSASNRYFYIDDGSGFEDGLVPGRKGIKVTWLWMSGYPPNPTLGAHASVTGLVSCFQSGGKTYPMLLLRSRGDLVQY